MIQTHKEAILVLDSDTSSTARLDAALRSDYNVLSAENSAQGWEILDSNRDNICCIVMDRILPDSDGMAFMAKLKAQASLAKKPVIMQSNVSKNDYIREAIQAGVYYYLAKPYDVGVMHSIIKAAVADYKTLRELSADLQTYKPKLHLVRESFYEIKTLDDAKYLSTFLANYFPDPERVILGLSEFLINAIEHGNLGITYDEKSQLLKDNLWQEEIARRQEMPEYAHKRALVHFKREDDSICVTIKDEGKGFNWQKFMDIDPERATHAHGRGIALSKMASFDDVQYIGCGNEVVCKVNL